MQTLDFNVLYVADPAASAAFYSELLGRRPVEVSPSFAMFAFGNKAMLGLWGRDGVVPPVKTGAGGSELAFAVADKAAVDAAHDSWVARNWPVALPPTGLDLGYTAVVLDPDGHRIRVMQPGG
jgi:catechol 2,3-dioxygenase-like lactoylglutathione lyase family enzyme